MSKKKKDISEAVTLESTDENIVVADTEAEAEEEGKPSVSEEKEEKKKKHKEKNGDRKRKRRKRSKKKERKKLGKKGWMIIGGVIAGIVLIYLGISAYFIGHFYVNTQINGKDFSGKNAEAVKKYIKEQVDGYELKIIEQGPVYMRFGRLAVPVINDRPDYQFELGKGVVLREGKDLTIIATGLPVSNCLEAAEKLAADGIDAKVINIHTIKPLDEELVVAAAKETGRVVTVEEHSVIGGLGSAVCDVLSEKAPTRVMKIGINDTFGESGPALELLKKYGLDTDSIYAKIKAFACE